MFTGLSAENRPLRPRAFASKSARFDRAAGAGFARAGRVVGCP